MPCLLSGMERKTKNKRKMTTNLVAAAYEATYEKRAKKIAALLSAAHLLNTEAIALVDESEGLMDGHIKIVRELKYNSKRLQFVFDEYVRSFNKLVKQPEAFKYLAADFEDFDLAFRKYAKLTDL